MPDGFLASLEPGDVFAFLDGRFRVEKVTSGDFVMMVGIGTGIEKRILADRLFQMLSDGSVTKVQRSSLDVHVTLGLKRDDVLMFPTGRFRFSRELSKRVLLLQNEDTGLEMQIPEEKLVRLLGDGTVTRDELLADADGRLRPNLANDDVGPGEEGTDKVVRARSLKFYTDIWDGDIRIGRGKKALGNLININRANARQRGCTWDVKPARLKFAIDNCGVPGNRPLRLFLSRRGKTKRQRLPMALEVIMSQAVRFYWGDRKRDFNDTFAYFHHLLSEENAKRKSEGKVAIAPPVRMEALRRRINAAEAHLTWSQKYSKFEADQRFRGVSESLKANRPGELVIMDHTTMDNWVLFDDVSRMPLGRLTLTVAIDVATRCVLGFLVSAEPPSLYSVMTVLKRANKEKSYVAELYPAIEGEWDSWCHIEELLVDNGWEFLSPSFQDALADLGTKVKWAPIHTPAFKAIGERFFHTLNTMMIHKLPNSVQYDPKTTSALHIDPTKDMVVTVSDLDRLMHQCIIEVYQQETHSGLRAIPARIWQEKIAEHKRRFISDVSKLDTLLGRVDEVALDRAGVRFKNMVFHDREGVSHLLEDLIALQAKTSQSRSTKASARMRVKIKWNPEDCTRIHVYNAGGEPKHYVTLYNRDEQFAEGLSFWHAAQVYKFAKQNDLAFRSDAERWAARNRLREAWEELAPVRPLRLGADARRALAQERPTLEKGEIITIFANPTTDGTGKPIGLENTIPAFDRLDDEKPVRGARRGGQAATKKAAATREANQRKKGGDKSDDEAWSNDNDIENVTSTNTPVPLQANSSDVTERVSWARDNTR